MGNIAWQSSFDDWMMTGEDALLTITDVKTSHPVIYMTQDPYCIQTKTNSKVAIKIRKTWGGPFSFKFFFIGNHNFSGGTLDINTYTNADFVTGKVTVETVAVRELDMYHYESVAPAGATYWEWDLTNVTTAADHFAIGRLMLVPDINVFTEAEDYEIGSGYEFENVTNITPHGVRWSYNLSEKLSRFEPSWTHRTQTSILTELKELWNEAGGVGGGPLVFIPDISQSECHYVHLVGENLNWSKGNTDYYSGLRMSALSAARHLGTA